MNIIDAPQGSAEWLAIRAKHFTASEAPAMLGASKYQTRSALLRQKATGLAEEVDEGTQRLFDRGHAAEAAARPIVEGIIGSELFPATGSLEVDGLPLLASFDGLTMLEDMCWENKLLNNGLAESIRSGEIEPHYYWQLEQQLLVSGAEKVYFTTSDGTPDGTIGMWYEAVPGRREQLIAGWKQFAEDLANYEHVEPATPVVAAPVESLPALAVSVTGSISLTHNLDRFGKRLTEFVGSLNSKPETDQDFANLDAAVKVLKEAEAQLDAAESNALAQTTTIADMQNLVAMYRKVARDNRLMFEKIVKQEKVNRKAAIISQASAALAAHITGLNNRLGASYMPAISGGFAEATAGLKSLDSMRDKVATALANAKIEANEIADRIWENRTSLQGETHDWIFLFPDFAHVCTKATDDFAALLAMRLNQEDERQEAERESIRQEEAAKLAAEAKRAEEAKTPVCIVDGEPAFIGEVFFDRFGSAFTLQAMPDGSGHWFKNKSTTLLLGCADIVSRTHADAQAKHQAAKTARDNDQRGKADAGITTPACEQTTAAPDAGSMPVELPAGNAASAASTPPIQVDRLAGSGKVIQSDESMVDDFIRLLPIVPAAKKALRNDILAWEKYRIAREMAVAA